MVKKMTRYIVSISGGAGSTLALERVIAQHGYENTRAIFADTNTEDESLYDLIRHIPERHPELEFIWLNDGRNIWDVFTKSGIIKTPNGACKASLELKQKPIVKWVKENCDPDIDVMVSGLEWTEPERRARFDKRWEPYVCWHPLADAPVLSNCQIKDDVIDLGYPKQVMYERRYPHNNCGGGCVLAGQGQWAGLYGDNPDLFYWHMEQEKAFNELHRKGKKQYSILRDQGKAVAFDDDGNMSMKKKNTPIMLDEFEQMILNNTVNLRDFRSTCGCFLGEQFNMFDLLDDDCSI